MDSNPVLFLRKSKVNGSNADTSTEEEEWDDTKLVEAYEKAMMHTQDQVNKEKPEDMTQKSSSKHKINSIKSKKWKEGDKCRSIYPGDSQMYEVDVIKVYESEGTCIVRYLGYKSDDKVPLSQLKPSDGETARLEQVRKAMQTRGDRNDMQVDEEQSKEPISCKKSHKEKKKSKSKSSLGPNIQGVMSGFIPPPPPPHIFPSLPEDAEPEALGAMLMSWYMSGYHTGYYQGMKHAKK